MKAERPCGNCRHPECSDCYPRPVINKPKIIEAPKLYPESDPTRTEWARLHVYHLTKKRFYGRLTLMFEDGKITRGEILESIKP